MTQSPLRKSAAELVAEAREVVDTLTLDEAQALHGEGSALFVDIRDVRELKQQGTIPGAFHAPRGMLEFWVDPQSPYYKPVFAEHERLVLFCQSSWRSALAAKSLSEMGVVVAHIDGGFKAWQDAGGAVAPPKSKGEN